MFTANPNLRIAVYGSEVKKAGKGVGLWAAGYQGAIAAAGGNATLLAQAAGDESWAEVLEGFHGVVVAGFHNTDTTQMGDVESLCLWCKQHRFPLLAIDRGLRYLDSGVPDLLWCEFPTAERGAVEQFCGEIRKRFPKARFAFNYSSSFKWYNEKNPITWADLGELGVGFIFITLALQHAAGHGMSMLLNDLKQEKEQGYMALQRKEWADGADIPTRSHHVFSGVPYHQHVGQEYGATRLSDDMDEHLEVSQVV